MARTAHRRSTALARRSVTVRPIVVRQTKIVKAKRKHHRGGGGGMLGGFLSGDNTGMMLAGAVLGFVDKSSYISSLPRLPFLGEHGTIALGSYMLSRGNPGGIAAKVCKLALGLSTYELIKNGSITGDDPLGF